MSTNNDEEDSSKEKHGDPGSNTDVESTKKKLPYPKSVFFIVSNEFCERFSYYGMKAVLTLYFKNVLGYKDDTATILYHVFSMFSYFTPLFGAMLADSLLGKFKTIFYLSIVYAAGCVILALAATPPINIPAIPFSMIGLALIAVGTGGIKPCVAAFGGDQFVLPQQAVQLASFFSFFYMAISCGSFVSTFVTPILRKDVHCFDQQSCYSLAFSIPAALMLTSLIIFLLGKPLYRTSKPEGNVGLKVIKCISHAISRKRKTKASREHWLDNADDTYEPRFIEDVKILLRVLVLYLPLPVFWALYDQQGSRWTLQATRMDGIIFGYTIKPDQIQVINPMLILLFIPLFDKLIYPLLAKYNLLTRPLQRLTMGGILAGIALIASGLVELQLEKNYPNRLEENEANLHFVNTLPCSITLEIFHNGKSFRIAETIDSYNSYVFETLPALNYEFTSDPPRDDGTAFHLEFLGTGCTGYDLTSRNISAIKSEEEKKDEDRSNEVESGGGFTYVIGANAGKHVQLSYTSESDHREKPDEGNPKLKFIVPEDNPIFQNNKTKFFIGEKGENHFDFFLEKTPTYGYSTETLDVKPVEYRFIIQNGADTIRMDNIEPKLGGSYIITVNINQTALPVSGVPATKEHFVVLFHTITKESSLHMFWLLPQYVIISAGEIMFSITGLEFSYSQSPVSMKSVLQSCWLLTVAFGNLIDVIIAAAKFFPEQSKEFFLLAGIMFVNMICFSYMAWRYIPAVHKDPSNKKASFQEAHEDKES